MSSIVGEIKLELYIFVMFRYITIVEFRMANVPTYAILRNIRETSLPSLLRKLDVGKRVNKLEQVHAKSKQRNTLNNLGVRDIPAFSYPVYDIPRYSKLSGYVFVNKIIHPKILSR